MPAPKGTAAGKGGAPNQLGRGPGQKRPVPKMGNFFVCYRYNEKNGCSRQQQGQGCKGPARQVFAHACTFVKQNGDYCLGYHTKLQHK